MKKVFNKTKAHLSKKFKTYLVLCFVGVSGFLYFFYYDFSPALLAKLSFYQNLANPYVRIVRVEEGLRKEQVAEIIGDKLDWTEEEKNNFINIHLALNTKDLEGRYFPKTYLLNKDETPAEVTNLMFEEFDKQTEKIKKPQSKELINEDTIIKIASIIQRESNGKKDMKLISGIIWNRIFNGMKLQMDATLQYAKGSEEEGWWGQVDPDDKNIKSAYNTYLHGGFPPSAIANPGLAAIDAAYNPQKTNCLFYLHDRNKQIHCSPTYEGHKRNIEIYFK